jgi:hypothetical protein
VGHSPVCQSALGIVLSGAGPALVAPFDSARGYRILRSRFIRAGDRGDGSFRLRKGINRRRRGLPSQIIRSQFTHWQIAPSQAAGSCRRAPAGARSPFPSIRPSPCSSEALADRGVPARVPTLCGCCPSRADRGAAFERVLFERSLCGVWGDYFE